MSAYRNGGSFLLLSFLWGTAFVAIKVGLEFIPPVTFAAFRYDVAGLIMLAYAASVTDYWLPRSWADWMAVILGSTLIIALYNAFLFIGQQGVNSGVAAILVAMNPILATGFSRLFLPNERLKPLGIAGLVLGFVGVGLVVSPSPSNLLADDLTAPGFIFLAAVCVALGSVLVQRIDSGISTEGMVAWSCVFGAVVLHAVGVLLPAESLEAAEFTIKSILVILYLSVLASAIGYFIYFDLLERLGAIEINLVSYTAPVFAALFGWIVLNETLDPLTVVGFGVIVAGFVLLKREALINEFGSIRRVIVSRRR